MDVPFRGMQRHHDRLYLAALDDPSAEGLTSQINFQTYPGRDLSGFADWGTTGVRRIHRNIVTGLLHLTLEAGGCLRTLAAEKLLSPLACSLRVSRVFRGGPPVRHV